MGGTIYLRTLGSGADLQPNERGIMIGPPMSVVRRASPYNVLAVAGLPEFHSVAFSGRRVARELLYQSLMFWDRIAIPQVVAPIVGPLNVGLDSEELTLVDVGKVIVPQYELTGLIESVVVDEDEITNQGSHTGAILESQIQEFRRLRTAEPGRWAIANEFEELPLLVGDRGLTGLTLELTNAVPIVTRIDHLDGYLRFLEDRSDERRRLMASMDTLALDISSSEDPATTLNQKKREIQHACSELFRVSAEKNYSFSWGDLRLSFAWNGQRAWQSFGAVGGTVAIFDTPWWLNSMAGAGAAAVSQVKLTPAPDLRSTNLATSPYAVVLKLQYPGVG